MGNKARINASSLSNAYLNSIIRVEGSEGAERADMDKCLFDKKGQHCHVMKVTNEEKDNYCHICKSRCTNEHDLIRRYAPMVTALDGQHKYFMAKELRKFIGRKVKLVKFSLELYEIKKLLIKTGHTFDTLGNVVNVSPEDMKAICKGEATSYQTAKIIAEELEQDYRDIFDNLKMS